MDSLLATYASSDEEEDRQQQQQYQSHQSSSFKIAQSSSISTTTPQTSSISLSLPKPKSSSSSSSSLSFSLPPPKSSSNFSSLPLPKSNKPTLTPDPTPKRVVQFKPPINPSLLKPPEEDDDDDEHEKERKSIQQSSSSTQTSSLKSFFSSLPAPKNSLGFGSAPALGAGRRSIVETESPVSNSDGVQSNFEEMGSSQKVDLDDGYGVKSNFGEMGSSQKGNWDNGSAAAGTNTICLTSGSDASLNWEQSNEAYGSYEYAENYGNYGDYGGTYGNYDGSVATGGSSVAASQSFGVVDSMMRMPGKRGRNDIPTEIIEVKQDELMKNRPREDQVKMTGIAFGPSYQPVSTSKGKPTKLHKRKHQIGSLYFDMRQKEMELAERRAKGFLTKAETQAKYGW